MSTTDEEMERPDPVERPPIRGQVAAILNNHALAINRGSTDGVAPGMRFAVLHAPGGPFDIPDPETGESLGQIDYPKVLVRVAKINGEHLSVARTYRSTGGERFAGIASSTPISQILGGGTTPVRYESLEADENTRIDRQIDPVKSIVNVGDTVVEVRGDEFEGLTSFG